MSEADRAVYDAGWSAKLDEIRARDPKAPVVPYEAHNAGLAAVREQALADAREAVARSEAPQYTGHLAGKIAALAAVDNLKGGK